jgi:hypothetical protein
VYIYVLNEFINNFNEIHEHWWGGILIQLYEDDNFPTDDGF